MVHLVKCLACMKAYSLYVLTMFAGLKNCGINVHQLVHLTYYVRCFGPLWTQSAFGFEGQMQNFLRHSHATHGIDKQVCTFMLYILCMLRIVQHVVLL